MNTEEVRQYLHDSGLARIADDILALAKPAIRVNTQPVPEESVPVGGSKMGGNPDLPDGFAYPAWHEPMRFIAQFNLASVHKFDREGLLPTHGLLSFFYETDGEPLYSESLVDQEDDFPREEARNGWRVLYFDQTDFSGFSRVDAYQPENLEYPNCAVTFSNAITIPEYDSYDFTTEDEEMTLIDVTMDINRTEFGEHQLLGHPFSLEGSPLLDAADLEYEIAMDKPLKLKQMREAFARWGLLFQVTSSQDLNMDWAGGGFISYCIEHAKLAQRDFSNTWLVLDFL